MGLDYLCELRVPRISVCKPNATYMRTTLALTSLCTSDNGANAGPYLEPFALLFASGS